MSEKLAGEDGGLPQRDPRRQRISSVSADVLDRAVLLCPFSFYSKWLNGNNKTFSTAKTRLTSLDFCTPPSVYNNNKSLCGSLLTKRNRGTSGGGELGVLRGKISADNWVKELQKTSFNNRIQLRVIALPFGGVQDFTQLLVFHVKDTGERVLRKE